MLLTLQIAAGIWLGVLFLTGTFAAFFWLAERVKLNKRRGYSRHHGLLPTSLR